MDPVPTHPAARARADERSPPRPGNLSQPAGFAGFGETGLSHMGSSVPQLMMCAMYAICKVKIVDLRFKTIVTAYKNMPNTSQDVMAFILPLMKCDVGIL